MKDNFLLKKEQREIFESLSNEDAGLLIKGIFRYVCDGESDLDGLLKTIFIPIKNDIDKNEKSYQKRCETNKENINKRWQSKNEDIPNDTNVYEDIPNDTDARHISNITNHNSNIINHNTLVIKEIIDYLNKRINSNYKYTTKATQKKINARLNEGYCLDDFIAVIDKKYVEWKGTEFEKYLCPETLFGTKFEKYVNQKNKALTTKDLPIDLSNF